MSTAVPLERKHIPLLPNYLPPIRILQLLFGLTVLGLAAYGVSVYSTSGLGLTLFTAIVTVITTIYALVTSHKFLVAYNYWTIIALDLFLIIFWLISFAKDAAEANAYRWWNNFDGFVWVGTTRTWRNALIADAVLGAILFVLYIISLLATVYYVTKHRKAGGHCVPYSGQADVELAHQQQADQNMQAELHNVQPLPVSSTAAIP